MATKYNSGTRRRAARASAKKTAAKKKVEVKKPVKKASTGGQMGRNSKTKKGLAGKADPNHMYGRTPKEQAPYTGQGGKRTLKRSIKNDVTGGVKTKAGTYKTFKKSSAAAKDFRSTFAIAKKKGYKTFTWNGKKYSTKTK